MLGAKTFAHVYVLEVDDGGQSLPSSVDSSVDSSPIIPNSEIPGEDGGAYGRGRTDLQSNKPLVRLGDDGGWVYRLREAAERVLEAGGDAEVLGSWSIGALYQTSRM